MGCVYMYVPIYQNTNTTKKHVVYSPNRLFAYEAHQGTQQLKKAIL